MASEFDLGVGIGEIVVFHDDFELVDLNVAGFVIVGHLNVHIFAEAAQHRGAHGFFKRDDEHVAVKTLIFADLVDGLFEFKIHGCLRLLALRRKYLWLLRHAVGQCFWPRNEFVQLRQVLQVLFRTA